MALFVGTHVNKVDRKARVSVPKPFRAALRTGGHANLFVFPNFKQRALEACAEDFMTRLSQSLEALDLFSDEQDDLASVILANAHELSFDPEGRIVLPKVLQDHAGIAGEALFVGQGPRFQIWEPAAFQAFNAAAFERARARGATLKLRPAEPTGREGDE